ncbi:MAG: biotin--[acetyl-CoA-carboxylase] ligase [Bacteroidaceae bacterium]|nr:biotin--[acetyl-CoA-carboxylase] ligase [Bacteroidaceae bacterium]
MSTVSYHQLAEIASTNSYVMENIGNYAAESVAVVFTESQTAGRGMGSNSWESEAGRNIAFSIVFHPTKVKPAEQFVISMAVSVAIVRVLQEMFAAEKNRFSIKWPNDIYWKDRKLGGILIENALKGSCIATSILGIGINVNQEKFLSDAPNPVSLKQITGEESNGISLMKAMAERFSEMQRQMGMTEKTASEGRLDEITIDSGRLDEITVDDGLREKSYDKVRAEYHSLLFRNDNHYHPFKEGTETFQAKIVRVQNNGKLFLLKESGEEKEYWLKEVEYITPKKN